MKTTIMTMVALGTALLLPSVTDRVAWSMGERVPVVGTPAADFTLTDLDGQTQSLRQYRGKIVLVNFWATWCKPCTTEMPAMQVCYDKLRDRGLSCWLSTNLRMMRKSKSTFVHTVIPSR